MESLCGLDRLKRVTGNIEQGGSGILFDRMRTLFHKNTESQEGSMYIIAGLGNPDRKYQNTRHNIGFEVIDAIAGKNQITVGERRHKAIIGRGYVGGRKAVLVKPQTYMNLSGESIRQAIDFYKVDEKSELIVIADDVSLEPGQIRIRRKGAPAAITDLRISFCTWGMMSSVG